MTTRNMESNSLIQSREVKQEPVHEETMNYEQKVYLPFLRNYMKKDPWDPIVKKEVNAEEESEKSLNINRACSGPTSIPGPTEDIFLYCEQCHLKHKGPCPEHGFLVYVDNAKTARKMESNNLIQGREVKQEPVHEETMNYEQKVCLPFMRSYMKQDFEDQTVKKEVNAEEESEKSLNINRTCSSPTSLLGPNKGIFLYCEQCHLKHEGLCPEHRFLVHVDNAKADHVEGCHQGFSPQVQVTDTKGWKVSGKDNVTHPSVCKTQIDNADTSQNENCSTLQSNVEENMYKKIPEMEKPFSCEIIHVRTHTGEKPYKCDACGARFSQSGALKLHKRTHTGEKPFKCDVCDSGFFNRSKLLRHKKTHTGEKPYKCSDCGTEYAEKSNLNIHMRKHTGEKLYKCSVCGTEYAEKRYLNIHMRIHTEEKLYKCSVCGTEYAEKRYLNIHMRTHTGKKAVQM